VLVGKPDCAGARVSFCWLPFILPVFLAASANKQTVLSAPPSSIMPADFDPSTLTAEQLPELLKDDLAVKVAGIDVDGILRGKLMAKKKFISIANEGFGFCSVIFGWDMHDQTYFKELAISNKENGYRDLIAVPDLSSFRRIPWEDNVPFFLISFQDPDTKSSLSACPRSLLRRTVDKLKDNGYGAMAGGESNAGGRSGAARR
jgi:glutamine synthetase